MKSNIVHISLPEVEFLWDFPAAPSRYSHNRNDIPYWQIDAKKDAIRAAKKDVKAAKADLKASKTVKAKT